MSSLRTGVLFAASLAVSLSATAVGAASILGLTDDNKLVTIDSDARTAGVPMTVSGMNGKLLGIDVRPANGMVYGVGSDGMLYTIDPMTGRATMASKLSKPFPTGNPAVFDFNPVADRLRLMSSDGTNYRINVDTGEMTTDGTRKFDPAAMIEETPMVTAGAYTNSYAGTKETKLYDIDTSLNMFLLQAPPNDGVLKRVGNLGITFGHVGAFDIVSNSMGGNTAMAVAMKRLYTIDLDSGVATEVGTIAGLDGMVIDIAVLPKAM